MITITAANLAYFAIGVLVALILVAIYGARATRAYVLRTFARDRCAACRLGFERRQFVVLNLDAFPEIPLHVQCWDDAIFSGRPMTSLVAEWVAMRAVPAQETEQLTPAPVPEPRRERMRVTSWEEKTPL